MILKKSLSCEPLLQSLDTNTCSSLVTDASTKGLGTVPKHVEDGKEVTVLFLSRALVGPENHYSVIEIEDLCIYWAIIELKNFLWGDTFIVRSDHKPLKDVFAKKALDAVSSRICRWVVALKHFDFKVEYIPGDGK